MDIGVMPLCDGEWARGKCSFKMLQYLAVGIPVVVSPVGMNADVLSGADVGFGAYSESDWVSSLHKLCDDEGLRRCKGGNGRQLVERNYSTEVAAARLAAILREVYIDKTC
jgi:glycosyltransferase involved in cell wall biosynthesis